MEIKWEQIAAANAAIKTTDIKDKDYAEVNQRVKAFRMVYPTGLILTEMVSNENGVCIFRATAAYYNDKGEAVTLATGTAFETQNSTYINKTSYIENCETSAVGRALGMAGFGIDTSICSADELNNAHAQQEANKAAEQYPKPVERKPAPKERKMPAETAEDKAYRELCIRKIRPEGLDNSCMAHFKTDFAHTPVATLRTVLPEEMLNKMEDRQA